MLEMTFTSISSYQFKKMNNDTEPRGSTTYGRPGVLLVGRGTQQNLTSGSLAAKYFM